MNLLGTRPVTIALACVLVVVFMAYSQALSGPWLFDDFPNLIDNPLVQIDGSNFDEWRAAAFSSGSGPLRRPISMLSFAANHAVDGGFSATTVKATNVLLHCFNGILVYFICITILSALYPKENPSFPDRFVALVVAALWLLHPLHVSTVLYAVQRMAQLSALFMLLGLYVFTRYRSNWAQHGASMGEVLAATLWLGLIMILAVLSKENGILLFWLLLVVEVTIFRGVWGGNSVRWLSFFAWLLFLLPVLLVFFLVLINPELVLAGYSGRDFTFQQRVLTQSRLLWHYIGWILLPNINEMGLHHDDISWSGGLLRPWTTALAITAWVVALAIGFINIKRMPLFLFALLFYLVGHSLESTILPLEMVFEHRNYLPSVGILLFAVWAITKAARLYGRLNPLFLPGAVVLLFLVFLQLRVITWSDENRLMYVNLLNHPSSVRSQHMYINNLLQRANSARESGLTGEERKALIVAARQQYEELQAVDETGLPTLVMLYQVDSIYFPELGDRSDWLARIEQQIGSGPLQPTDISALKTLMRCLGSGICQADESAPQRVLDRLQRLLPSSPQLAFIEYEYLLAVGSERSARLELLQDGAFEHPAALRFYYLLIDEYSREGDIAGIYESARLLMANDPKRLHLPALRKIFSGVSASSQ